MEEVLSHWQNPVKDFELSPSEFYGCLKTILERRQVPGLVISQIEHHEGSLLSAQRVYLRLKRERMWLISARHRLGLGISSRCGSSGW